MKSNPDKTDKWRVLIKNYNESDLTMKDFCLKNGVKIHQVQYIGQGNLSVTQHPLTSSKSLIQSIELKAQYRQTFKTYELTFLNPIVNQP